MRSVTPLQAPELLRLDDLTVAPDGHSRPVIEVVKLEAKRGECLALTGPSGSGKTTLLRTINGQIRPPSGRIIFDGEDLASLTSHARRRARQKIAFVPQKHDLVEPLKVHRNVMAGALGRWSQLRALRYLFVATKEELAEALVALEAVGLGDKLHESTAALSGGEQQRVAIARALVQAPKLLLADEPVASLDPKTANEVLTLLTNLARSRGVTLICSLHQPDLASRYFDRIMTVRGGRLVEELPPCGKARWQAV
jgi:phosphonate transport system ATP-binding protein